MGLMDFFSQEAGQERRRWLDKTIGDNLHYYLGGTGIDEKIGQANELLNPVMAMERASAAGTKMLSPGVSGWDRAAAGGDMLLETAGIVAPAAAARVGGLTASKAADGLTDALTGMSAMPKAMAGEFAADEFGGLRLYHGSPHDFDKFSMDKIGTGEGAQAYGHGLYFAENEGVAKGYRDTLSQGAVRYDGQPGIRRGTSPDDVTISAVTRYITQGNDPEMAMRRAANDFAYSARKARAEGNAKWAQEYEELGAKARALDLSKFDEAPGRMYEVDIDANPDDFLDWDAPLSAQNPKVREVAEAELRRYYGSQFDGQVGNTSRRPLGELLDATDRDEVRKAGRLKEAGIPGIKYLDAGSRGAAEGSRNYVIFDEKQISIVKKYGIAGAATILGMSALDVEKAMARQPEHPPQRKAISRMMGAQ